MPNKNLSSSGILRHLTNSPLHIALLVGTTLLSTNMHAHGSLDIVSGTGWQASVDGTNWVNATAPYPNPVTMPITNTNGTNQPDPGTSNGQLMWYGGTNPNTSLPWTHVIFRYTFDFSSTSIPPCPQPGPVGSPIVPDCGAPYGAWIAADDLMSLTVNNISIGTYVLDEHMLNGQPNPGFFDFTNALLQGQNTIEIDAKDGCFSTLIVSKWCQQNGGFGEKNRGFQYVFFDAQLPPNKPVLSGILPVPSTLPLMILGLFTLGVCRRKSHF